MKLHIFGASGTGVTTLGSALSQQLGIRYFDSDDYFWHHTDPPFTTRRDPALRNEMISRDLETHSSWILGGSIIHWDTEVTLEFDLIIFLYLTPEIRLLRLQSREFERYGELIRKDPARRKQFDEFIEWSMDYDGNTGIANRTLFSHEEWLSKAKSPVLRLTGDLSTEERIRRILEAAG